MNNGLKLAPLFTEIKVDIAGFKNEMEAAKTIGERKAEEITKALSGTAKVGDLLEKAGSALTKGLTVPLAGAGVASVNMAIDFEDSLAKVSTIADTSRKPLAQLKEEILELSSQTGESASGMNEALYQAISAGVDTAEAVDFLGTATQAAVGGFTDTTTAVDGLTTVLNSYGKSASEADSVANQMLITQNLGKTTFGELASSVGQVTPVAAQLNVTTQELFSSLAVTTAQGLGTSESVTALKGAMSNIIKPTKEASDAAGALGIDFSVSALQSKGWIGFLGDLRAKLSEAAPQFVELSDKVNSGTQRLAEMEQAGQKNTEEYKNLKKEVSNATKEMEAISQANDSTIGGFATMFGSVEGLNSILMLTSEQGMGLYNKTMGEMETNTTALRDAYDKMDEAPGRQMQKAMNEIKISAIEMGDELLPLVSDIVGDIRDLVRRFNDLSGAQKENILKWAGIAAAAGPAMKLIGGGIGVFTKLTPLIGGASSAIGTAISGQGLVGALAGMGAAIGPVTVAAGALGAGIYAIHEQGDLMNSTVLKSREEMSYMELALADLQGVTVYTKEELQDMGYVYEDFNENISPEFQQAVKDSTKDVQEFNKFVHEINFDGVLDEEEQQEFSERVESMCNKAIDTINRKKQEMDDGFRGLFLNDEHIDEDEQAVLDYFQQIYDESTAEVTRLKDEINRIKQAAADRGEEMNDEEKKQVSEHYATIGQIELEATAGNQEEMLYAKNDFQSRVKNLDLTAASELLKEQAKIRDDEIKQINTDYDVKIDTLKGHLDGMDEETRKHAEAEIQALEGDKQAKIGKQQELFESYIDIVKEGNAGMVEEISKYTGEVLTEADRRSQGELEKVKTKFAGIDQIEKTGHYLMYNNMTKHYEAVAVKVDEATGDIVGVYDRMTGDCAGATTQMAKDTEKMSDEFRGSYTAIHSALDDYFVDGNEVKNTNGEILASMENVTSATDGTRTGIVKINDTPYEITVNADGTVRDLRNIDEEADRIVNKRRVIKIGIAGARQVRNALGMSHYNGLDHVPYDGYQAILHKDERVLTAEENKAYSAPQPQSYPTTLNAVLNIDGREFTRATLPLIDAGLGEMARRGRRK